ncbi:MAG TPA: hypothetical protein VN661_10685 [Candidatus Acidoferrales bacterium]|nr:hypothetical protein [Candidatus Acidoferrales bacterium]
MLGSEGQLFTFLESVGAPFIVFAAAVLIIWLNRRRDQAAIQAQAEVRAQIIQKFGSAQELTAFLETKSGQLLLQGVGRKRGWWLRVLGWGVVLTMLGLALLGTELAHRGRSTDGVVVLAVGIGFLILAATTRKFAPEADGETAEGGSDRHPKPLV